MSEYDGNIKIEGENKPRNGDAQSTVEGKTEIDAGQPRVAFCLQTEGNGQEKQRAEQAQELLGGVKEEEPATERVLRSYKRRWLVLAVVAMLNNANTMSWIAFAPVANFVDQFYDSKGAANWFSLVYMICNIPMGFFAMWAGRRFGLRTAILLAGWSNGLGALIRFSSSFVPLRSRFAVGITGQCIASIAYPFIMFLPSKVAGSWFPDTQRALATTIGIMANPLGVLFASLISPRLVKHTHHVVYLNALTFVPSAIICLLASIAVNRSSPKLPPTHTAAHAQTPFFAGVIKCLKSRSYMVLLVVMGGGMGMFNTLYTLMQQLLCPMGYTNEFAGLCSSLLIIGGIFGASASGVFVDRTKKYEETMKVAFSLAVVCGLCFVQMALHPRLQLPIAVICLVFGFLGLATYPVGLEMASECTFPVSEVISTGLIVLSGQLQSAIYIYMMTVLSKPLSSKDMSLQVCRVEEAELIVPKDMRVPAMAFSAIAVLLAVTLLIVFKPKYRRLTVEQSAVSMQAVKNSTAQQSDAQMIVQQPSEEVVA